MNLPYIANRIKDILDTVEVFSYYGFQPNRSGFICCPFHAEKTASLKVYPGHGGYHCFGCGHHGSVIDFVMAYFNLDFSSALQKLNDDFCLQLPIGEKLTLRKVREIQSAERKRKELEESWNAKLNNLQVEYDYVLGQTIKFHRIIKNFAPKGPEDEFHPLFVEALKKINWVEDELLNAETRLREHESGRTSYSDIGS